MECERCRESVPEEELREFHGRRLCEDCYMDALSPARTCDPWAVHSAKSFAKGADGAPDVTSLQSRILKALGETGGLEPKDLAHRVGLKPSELEKEIATLRHMELVRGELREGKKFIRLW